MGNLDADRASELIAFNADGFGYARAEIFPSWSEQPISSYPRESTSHYMRLWDANADGRDDWIAHTTSAGLALFSPSAGVGGPQCGLECGPVIIIGNLDADASIEALCGASSNYSAAAAELGSGNWEWRPGREQSGTSPPILADFDFDFDGDGVEEIATIALPDAVSIPSVLRVHDASSLAVTSSSPIDFDGPTAGRLFEVIAAVEARSSAGSEVAIATQD